MRAPEVSGLLFNKLCGRIDPIEVFQFRRYGDVLKRLKPLTGLRRGERGDGRKLFIDCVSFYWEFEVGLDDLAQQAGQ